MLKRRSASGESRNETGEIVHKQFTFAVSIVVTLRLTVGYWLPATSFVEGKHSCSAVHAFFCSESENWKLHHIFNGTKVPLTLNPLTDIPVIVKPLKFSGFNGF